MSRGATSAPGSHHVRDVLQSSGSKLVKLDVSYPSFQAPHYATPLQSIVGRLWLYDAAHEMVILETGAQDPLPAALRHTVASAVYEGGAPTRSAPGTVSGFKMVRVPHIVQADIMPEDARPTQVPAQLTTSPNVPSAAMEAREAAATRKCTERSAQLGPPEAGELGQSIFDGLCKTYVEPTDCSLPCRWHESHIIVLDEVVIVGTQHSHQSGPHYDVASTYVPNLSHEQLEQLLADSSDESIAPGIERAGAKALTWQRVTKVFVLSHFKTIKASNPKLPFLIRETQNTPARMFVRLERGLEKKAEIDGLEASAIEKKLAELLSN